MRGELRILNSSGHQLVEWDTEAPAGPLDPQHAEKEFNRLVRQGHLGFGTTAEGDSVQLKKFDPTYPKVTVSKPFVGG